MDKKGIALVLILAVCAHASFGQEERTDTTLSLHLKPGVSFPIGRDVDVFGIGGGISLIVRLPLISLFSLDAAAGYSIAPLNVAPGEQVDSAHLSLISPRLGLSITYELFSRFFVESYVQGGYYFASLNVDVDDNSGSNPLHDVGGGVYYHLFPTLSIDLGVSYRNFFGLYNDLLLTLGASYHFKSRASPKGLVPELNPYRDLEFKRVELDPVFPVFFKYYDDHPLGSVTIRNSGNKSLENVKVTLFVKQYMDNPKICDELEKISGGSEAVVDLFALFNDQVLGISESTKVQANIRIEAEVAGKAYSNEYVQTLRMHDRNALTWTDDRKAAAFVTMKDPTVLKFSKNVAGAIKDRASKNIASNLLAAMAIHEALNLYGMNYVIDPSTPYKEFSEKKMSLDYLQFPLQSLEYKAGDCDDLSILFCALLESIGIETAFITVPGHIYAAVALDITPLEAKKQFLRPEDLIYTDDRIWLPVEVTLRKDHFLKAWEVGAKTWREFESKGQAKLYPLHEAWELYEPVGFSGEQASISLPDEQRLVRVFSDQVQTFVQREISPRVSQLEQQIQASGGNARLVNRLGVLYARYGLNAKAKEEFEKVLRNQEFVPALVNAGNLYYQDFDYDLALDYYTRAYKVKPDCLTVLLCMARTNHAIENYGSAKRYYERLKAKSPEFAERYAYLELKGEEAGRAAEADKAREVMIWEE